MNEVFEQGAQQKLVLYTEGNEIIAVRLPLRTNLFPSAFGSIRTFSVSCSHNLLFSIEIPFPATHFPII